MAERVAEAEVQITLDDRASRELLAVEAQFERTVHKLDRERATIDVDVKVDEAKRDLRRVEAEYKSYIDRVERADNNRSKAQLRRHAEARRREADALRQTIAASEDRRRSMDKERKLADIMDREAQAIERRSERRQRIYEQNARRRQTLMDREHAAALRINREIDRQNELRERERRSLPRLSREYVELTDKIEKLNAARRKASGDSRSMMTVDFKIKEAIAKRDALIKILERHDVDLDVNLRLGPGHAIGREFRKISQDRGLFAAAGALGATLGLATTRAFTRSLRDMPRQSLGFVGRMARGFENMTVRLGPFTATVRQATIAMAILGPTVVDLTGALGSLVSVVGAGALGLSSLTAAVVGGAIPAAVGFFTVLKPVVTEIQNAVKASKAYNDAVMKYGKNSSQAASKLDQFNHVMRYQSEETKRAFLASGQLRDEWKKMTEVSRRGVWDVVGNGLALASANVDEFANHTNRGFAIVTRAANRWIDAIGSNEGRSLWNNLFGNFNKALGPLLDGLGSLGGHIARIASIASDSLPGITRSFRDWAQSVAEGSRHASTLEDRVNGNIGALRSLGNLALATGRFLVALFGGGVREGERLTDTMTAALNRWTAFLNTAEGQRGLQDFFKRAVDGTQALYNALSPLIAAFVEWSTNLSPAYALILNFLSPLSKFVGLIAEVVGMTGAAGTLATTLGTIWAVSRISKATNALGGFLRGLSGLETAAATTGTNVGEGIAGGIDSPASRAKATRSMKRVFAAGIARLGLYAMGFQAFSGIMQGMTDAGKYGGGGLDEGVFAGFNSKAKAVGRDFMSAVTFGAMDSADEAGAKMAAKVSDAIRRGVHIDFSQLGGGVEGINLADLTEEQQANLARMQRNMESAKARMQETWRDFDLPDKHVQLRASFPPRDAETLKRNWYSLAHNLNDNVKDMKKNTQDSLAAIAHIMKIHSKDGREAVVKNMQLTADNISRQMQNSTVSSRRGMEEIRRQFRIHSKAAKETTSENFRLAAAAIRQAARDGVISSREKLRQLEKLWVDNLRMYGFSRRQARNLRQGQSAWGGPDEGASQRAINPNARGGLYTIGGHQAKGRPAKDNVPAMLNGRPAVVAQGEQVAVFNRHQQRAMNTMLPGGLEGFFASNRRPHYMAQGGIAGYQGGGIVPVPGFPGESAAASVIPMIEMIARRFAVTLTDAFGPGHQSPGHTQFGTAADFSGPDRAMDAAVRFLVSRGYVVGYDGRFGSQRWPGHGPSYVAGRNAHFHVELGGAGGGMPMPEDLKAPKALQGLGLMTAASQAVLNDATAAANANIQNMVAAMVTPVGGGGGAAMGDAALQAVIAQALRYKGVYTPANAAALFRRVMQESGGNPNAVNNWDVNAANGDPSVGLAQIIGSTFARYRDRRLPNNRRNPMANLVAAINYMMAVYGHIVDANGRGYAQGGIVTDRKVSRQGGIVNQPTLLVGEEPSNEAVISLNPAYRKSNIERLGVAARALGVPMAARGYTGGRFTNAGQYRPGTDLGEEPPIRKRFKKGSRKAKKFNKRARRAFKSGRGYLAYIDGLQTARDDWETEAERRESAVPEPDELMKETGRIIGPDGQDYGPRMEIDEAGIASFRTALESVVEAMQMVFNIIRQIVQAVPNALTALTVEKGYREANIKNLKEAISKDEKLIEHRSKGKRSKEDREAIQDARKRIRENQKRLDHNQDVRDRIRDDKGELRDQRKDAAQALPDAAERLENARGDLSAYSEARLRSEVRDEVIRANDVLGDSPDTAGSGLSLGEQRSAAAVEAMNVLREFGGNANPNVGAMSGPAGLGGLAGLLRNPAGIIAPTATPSAASTALSGGAAAGQAQAAGVGGGAGVAAPSAAGGGGVTKIVNQTNNFAAPPPDPHLFSAGVKFDLEAGI